MRWLLDFPHLGYTPFSVRCPDYGLSREVAPRSVRPHFRTYVRLPYWQPVRPEGLERGYQHSGQIA